MPHDYRDSKRYLSRGNIEAMTLNSTAMHINRSHQRCHQSQIIIYKGTSLCSRVIHSLCNTPSAYPLSGDLVGHKEHVSVRSLLQLRTTSGKADSNVRQESDIMLSPIETRNHEDNSVPAQVNSQEALPPIGSVVPFERTPLVLPTEIWERSIDWLVVIYTKTRSRNYDINLRRDLFHCALVCRDWRFRAQKHLYAYIRINAHALSQFEAILRKTPILREFAQEFIFYNQYIREPGSQSRHTDRTTETASHALRIALRLPNVHYFSVEAVNLAREHPHLPRYMSLLHGIAHMGFKSCTRIKLRHLARLIVALKDVSAVALHVPIFVGPESTRLPTCYYNARSSPTELYLRVFTGGYLLLDWLIKAQSFIASLKLLQIELTAPVTRAEMVLIVQNTQALLVNCTKKLVEWRFWAWKKVDGLSTIPTGNIIYFEFAWLFR